MDISETQGALGLDCGSLGHSWLVSSALERKWGGISCSDRTRRATCFLCCRPRPQSTPEVRTEYWKWAEERILAPIKQQNPGAILLDD